MTNQKEKRLLALLKREQAEACLLAKPENVRFFSGFTGSFGIILFGPGLRVFITDSRYALRVKAELTDFTIRVIKREDPLALAAALLKKAGIRKTAVEEDYFLLKDFKTLSEKTAVRAVSISDLRMIKSAAELKWIEKASAITAQAFAHILTFVREGVLEMDLERELRRFLLDHDAVPSFNPIVAFGVNTALPHYETGVAALQNRSPLLIDFGARYKGYCADVTRTFFFGKASQVLKKFYNAVRNAQICGIDAVAPEKTGVAVDLAARNSLAAEGLDKLFGHGLGHGIGLEIHEGPRLSPKSNHVLKNGMVFTIEPGVYKKGIGGVRIEDNIALIGGRAKNLTPITKELIEL